MIFSLRLGLPPQCISAASTSADLLYLFANRTGRLSALREHPWNTDPGSADRTSLAFEQMVNLLHSATLPAQEAGALWWRIEAKATQRGLLSKARYRHDPRLRAQAQALLQPCLSLALGP